MFKVRFIVFYFIGTLSAVILIEIMLHLLFLFHLLPPNPIYMTSLEKRNVKITNNHKNLESKIIVYEDGIPRRGEGPSNYMQTGIPLHDVYFDQEGKRVDQYQGTSEDSIIGVFGDSFTEALQVAQDEDFSSLSESALRKEGYHVDFKNYGLGATGTSIQYARYKQLKAHGQKFDKIILVILLYNDVADNHPVLNKPFEHFTSYPYYSLSNDTLIPYIKTTKVYEREFLKSFLKDYSHIASTLNNFRQIMKIKYHPLSPKNDKSIYDLVCEEPKNENWKEAWAVTEAIIKQWNLDAINSGEDFLVVFFANRLGEMTESKRNETDCDYARERITGLLKVENIDFIDFDPIAKAYILDHHLKFPYFSFNVDSHFNPLGHKILSSEIVKILKKLQ